MEKRKLGDGPDVGALGFGCMGMSEFYGATNDAESLLTLEHAFSAGVTLFDTGIFMCAPPSGSIRSLPYRTSFRCSRADENLAAQDIALSDDEIATLHRLFDPLAVSGQPYPDMSFMR